MKNAPLHAVILAGGRGTRFWPKSRTKTPKQLLPFDGTASLLQETVSRLAPLVPPERVWILTNDVLARAVRRQLPTVPPRQVIAEPVHSAFLAQDNSSHQLNTAADYSLEFLKQSYPRVLKKQRSLLQLTKHQNERLHHLKST